MIMCCHVPQHNDDARTSQHGRNRSCIGPKKCTDYCADQGSAGIEMLYQYIRRIPCKNIAENTAAYTCDYANENCKIGIGLRNMYKSSLNSDNCEQAQADGVQSPQQDFSPRPLVEVVMLPDNVENNDPSGN